MITWSSYSETFYKYLLENVLSDRSVRTYNKIRFKNLIDASCSNITVYRNTPSTSKHYEDYLFSIPDSTLDNTILSSKHDLLNSKINAATVIHKSQSNHTSRRINNFYYSTGNKRNSIYSSPYENSYYNNLNLSMYGSKYIYKANVFKSLEHEIVNSLDTLCLYNEKTQKDTKHVILKPSGVLNAGIMGLELCSELVDEDVCLDVNEILNVYPSCFFSYEENCSNLFMCPFSESDHKHKIETSWDGYTLKSQIYNINNKTKCVNEDVDILEIKSENKSLFSSTVYSRNSLGIFVFRYYYDGEWKIRPLNNISYRPNDKVYYMCVSPYLSDEALFLKTNNELLIYDASLGHERDRMHLASLIRPDEDIVHTVGYGMDNNTVILGGSRLYCMDKRAKSVSELMLPLSPSITITSTNWTERNYDSDHPSRHYNKLLSGRYCSFSSYYRKCIQTYWKCFTAMDVHPVYNYILAAVCGASNSILIIDLRIPNSPVLDIPLTSAERIGARFRHIKWQCVNNDSFLFAFSWRQKYPICVKVKIDSSFGSYSLLSNHKYSYDDFTDADVNYDTSILIDRMMFLNFSNTDESEEDENFASSGPLIESQKDYFNLKFHLIKDTAMTNIFHGYLGMGFITIANLSLNLVLMVTTSGRLLCLDLNNRKVFLKRKRMRENTNRMDIDLNDESESFIGFNVAVSNGSGISLPPEFKFDKSFKFIKVGKNKIGTLYSNFNSINLQDNFVKIQEQHFGNDRINSFVSINDCYLADFKSYRTRIFDSKEILKMILSFDSNKTSHPSYTYRHNNIPYDDTESIVTVSRFNKLYGRTHIDSYNVWNPLNNKLDYEYESEFNNAFVKDPQLCSCPSLCDSIFDKYGKMFSAIIGLIDNHDLKSKKVTDINEKDPHFTHPPVSIDGIQRKLIEKLDMNESITVDKGVADLFGDMLLMQSSISGTDNLNQINDLHTEYCQADDVLCVDLDRDVEELESIPFVDQVLNSWVIEHREVTQRDGDMGGTRVYMPGDTVEHLKEHKRKQQQIISQILTSMDVKN